MRRATRGWAALGTLVAVACGGTVEHRGSEPSSAGVAGATAGRSSGVGGSGMMQSGGKANTAGAVAVSAGFANQGGTPPDLGGTGPTQGGVGGSIIECQIDCVQGIGFGRSDFGNPDWRDSWFVSGCRSQSGGDCITLPGECPSPNGAHTKETFPINGEPGQHYKVTFRLDGVVEGKQYQGGSRDVGSVAADVETAPSDTFYRDGEPVESGANVWKLTVFDDKGIEARHYFMNSFPDQSFETKRTFLVAFTKSIVVVGGGKIEHEVTDTDCRSVDNCGPGANGVECDASRHVPNVAGTLSLPAKYQDPVDGKVKDTALIGLPNATIEQPWHSQAGHLSLIYVELTADPVTMDYE